MLLGVEFQDTITLGAIITAFVVLLIAGVPVTLIRRLKEERDTERETRQSIEKDLTECRREISEYRAKTDLTAAIEKWEDMHSATLRVLDKLEAATAGGFAEFARSQERMAQAQERMAQLLDRTADKLNDGGS